MTDLADLHAKIDGLGRTVDKRMGAMESLLARLDERSVGDLRAQESFRSLTKEALARVEDNAVKRPEYEAAITADRVRLTDLEAANEERHRETRQNRNLFLGALVFPLVVAVVAALVVYAIVGR